MLDPLPCPFHGQVRSGPGGHTGGLWPLAIAIKLKFAMFGWNIRSYCIINIVNVK